MSNIASEKPGVEAEIDEAQRNKSEHDIDIAEKVDYNRSGAIDAENLEHRMGVLEAVRAYPSASWWALVMSCTIVSIAMTLSAISLTAYRSWRPTACS